MTAKEPSLNVFKGRVRLQAEGHIYFVDGRSDLGHVSVSGLLHDFFAEFEGPAMARTLTQCAGWEKSIYRPRAESRALAKLPGRPAFVDQRLTRGFCTLDMLDGAVTMDEIRDDVVSDVVQQWNEARDAGTLMHAELEDFYGRRTCRMYVERVLCDNYEALGGCVYAQFLRFHDEVVVKQGWRIFAIESRLVDDPTRICGSIDALFYNPAEPTGWVHLCDWKRSRKLRYSAFTRRGETPKHGKAPFEKLQDCNAMHYAVQQNTYRALIERNTALLVKSMHLVVLHPEHDDYQYDAVQDLQSEVNTMLAAREKYVIEKLPVVQ